MKSFLAKSSRSLIALPLLLRVVVAHASVGSASAFMSDTQKLITQVQNYIYVLLFVGGGVLITVLYFKYSHSHDDSDAAKHSRALRRAVFGIVGAIAANAIIQMIRSAYGY